MTYHQIPTLVKNSNIYLFYTWDVSITKGEVVHELLEIQTHTKQNIINIDQKKHILKVFEKVKI